MSATIALAGASGRMGQAVQSLIAADPAWTLKAAWDRDGVRDYGADALVDFSTPEAVLETAGAFSEKGGTGFSSENATHKKTPAWIVGVTGLGAEHHAAIAEAARRVPVVQSGNFSLGINVLLGLAAQAARALPDFDLSLTDIHHIHKKDSPSGTALMLQQALLDVRPGAGIPIDSRREGEVVGVHTVTLQGVEERLSFTHEAHDRALFARGALVAARWAVGKPAGLYTMRDVLFGG